MSARPYIPRDCRNPTVLVLLVLTLSGGASIGQEFDFFEKRIRPVLVEHCYRCHSASAEKIKGDLRLDTRDALRKGGRSGPAIVVGQADRSLLVEAIRYTNPDLHMPPKEQLKPQQVADIIAWVNAGAPDPRTNALADFNSQLATTASHWAFQRPRAAPLPVVHQIAWPRTPIDYF